jgi:hypothetical protein
MVARADPADTAMKLDCIITLASRPVAFLLTCMVRSLRATGCRLPVRVIPYDQDRFDLPEGCSWWEEPAFIQWIDAVGSRPVMRKYQVLLADRYLFVDTDVVFLRNPQVLEPYPPGWVTNCGHWHNPGETTVPEMIPILSSGSTNWPARVFNSGQFACNQALFSLRQLQSLAEDNRYRPIILQNRFHEQPGFNLLVHLSGIQVTNLTLPPYCMESSWAGDYRSDPRLALPPEKVPLFIHFAGQKVSRQHPLFSLYQPLLQPGEEVGIPDAIPAHRRGWRQRLGDAWRAWK